MLYKIQQAFANNDDSLEQLIVKTNALSSRQKITIYKNSIEAIKCGALAEIYPVCKKLVGDEFFNAMALRYIAKVPSRSPDLAQYGETFPGFILNFPHAASLPYLSDVAQLELAFHHSFLGPDNFVMSPEILSSIDMSRQEDIVFSLPVASTLIESPYPIHKIWETNQCEQDIVDLDEGGVKLIVYRCGDDFRMDELTNQEWKLLTSIAKVQMFSDVCNECDDIESLLPKLVTHGWINNFKYKE